MRALGRWLLACCLLPCLAARGDSIRILDDDAEAWDARLTLIQSARESIDAAYFDAAGDPTGLAMLSALRDAARRGVKVRLIVDGLNNEIPRAIQLHLAAEGMQIRVFHPLCSGNLCWIGCRMHDKLLIRDGVEMITGGRNMAAAYFGRHHRNHYRDRDVWLAGAVAEDADCYYESLWESEHLRPVPGRLPWEVLCAARAGAQAAAALDEAAGGLLNGDACKTARPARPLLEVPCEKIRFLHSSWIGCDHQDGIAHEILILIESSRRSILIETPYLQLSPRFRKAIESAVARGVEVKIATNSLASTDSVIAFAGYVNQRKHLRKAGVELCEYDGPECLHAKTLVIDDWCVVGSYNLNARSEKLDTEVAVCVEDAALARELRDSIAGDIMDGDAPEQPVSHPLLLLVRALSLPSYRLAAVFVKSHL